jgi:hypothetical protein
MSKTLDEEADLPSYEETTSNASTGKAMLGQLVLVREQHINSTISESIYPILSQRASQGLSKTSIALIPSNQLDDIKTLSALLSNTDCKYSVLICTL